MRRLAFGRVFGPQVAGKEAQFPDELPRFNGRRDRNFHLLLFRAAQFVERVGGQIRII